MNNKSTVRVIRYDTGMEIGRAQIDGEAYAPAANWTKSPNGDKTIGIVAGHEIFTPRQLQLLHLGENQTVYCERV